MNMDHLSKSVHRVETTEEKRNIIRQLSRNMIWRQKKIDGAIATILGLDRAIR